jgi:hypothetical protein
LKTGTALKRLLDIFLTAIFVLSVVALFLAHEDPFARDLVCARTGFCPVMPNAKAWNKIFYDLAVGALITLLFYLLVVRLPDYQRRQRLKKSLEKHYNDFRKDCIQIMLMVADGTYDAGFPETLVEQDKFRGYFKENVEAGMDWFDKFQNELDEYYLRELLTRMEILRDEIAFVLNNTDIPKDKPFKFLKRLSAAIYSMKDVALGYDELKPLAAFLWEREWARDGILHHRFHVRNSRPRALRTAAGRHQEPNLLDCSAPAMSRTKIGCLY